MVRENLEKKLRRAAHRPIFFDNAENTAFFSPSYSTSHFPLIAIGSTHTQKMRLKLSKEMVVGCDYIIIRIRPSIFWLNLGNRFAATTVTIISNLRAY